MGKLVYGSVSDSFEVEDVVLAHLRIVVMNKLRRSEPFFLHLPGARGPRSLWMHPSIPLVFHFYGSRRPATDRAWVEELMTGASGVHGLDLPTFPPDRNARARASRALTVDRVDHTVEEPRDEFGL